MANQESTGNFGKFTKNSSGNAKKPISTKMLIGSVLVLLAAAGIGMIIREIRSGSAEPEPIVQTPEETKPVDVPEVVKSPQVPKVPYIEPQKPVEEVVIEPEPQEPVQNVQVNAQDDQAAMQRYNQRRQDGMQMMSWFSNLTQEEQRQLLQGTMVSIMSLMQRWQNMPPEMVQAERAKFQELIQGWRDLPAEDRQQGIQNIQSQLELWLQSGQQQ